MKYEVEYKVELTENEVEALRKLFKEKGFAAKGIDQQADYYIEARASTIGKGYDLKRYRNESGKIIYTEKVWEMPTGGSEPARRETEHEATHEEIEAALAKYPEAIKIKKQREWFAGSSMDLPHISITIDSVKFDHSPSTRYFIEAETMTADISEVKGLKTHIVKFLKEILGKEEIVESPGMFTMAFEKR